MDHDHEDVQAFGEHVRLLIEYPQEDTARDEEEEVRNVLPEVQQEAVQAEQEEEDAVPEMLVIEDHQAPLRVPVIPIIREPPHVFQTAWRKWSWLLSQTWFRTLCLSLATILVLSWYLPGLVYTLCLSWFLVLSWCITL